MIHTVFLLSSMEGSVFGVSRKAFELYPSWKRPTISTLSEEVKMPGPTAGSPRSYRATSAKPDQAGTSSGSSTMLLVVFT